MRSSRFDQRQGVRRRFAAALVGLWCFAVPMLHAQTNPVTQAKELLSLTPSIDLPSGTLQADTTNARLMRATSRTVSPTPPVQIIEKPGGGSGPQPSLRFSTTVETRVDNRGGGDRSGSGEPPAPPAPAPKPPMRFEFEDFVEQTVGSSLTRFGETAFSSASYTAPEQIPLPPDYLLRPGDEVSTRAWGQIDVDHVGVVDKAGQLYIPRVGTIRVGGLRRDQLDAAIGAVMQKLFRNFELSTVVGSSQPVMVHVTGVAKRPGSVSLPPYSTLLTAVFQSGGIGPRSNVRRVQLRRGGQTIGELDLYEFLASGSSRGDLPIQSGDVIHFPVIEGSVAVAGSVNLPAIFQTKAGMTVRDLLALCGGISTTGKSGQAIVERITSHTERTIEIVALTDANLSRPVIDGELYTIVPISPRIENTVTLTGHVALPLRVAFRSGMRVSDLIPSADALILPSYWSAKNRANTLEALGERRTPEIKREMPEINWEYAVVERTDRKSTSPVLLPFNLGLAVNKRDPAHDLLLEAGDVITVFSKADFRIRADQRTRYVRIEGEVGSAGMYSVKFGTSLRQLIEKAGGLTPDAYVYGLELNRESTRQFQQARMTEAVDRVEHEFHRYFATRARNLTSQEEALAAPAEAENLKALIGRLRSLKATGRIVLELQPSDKSLDALPDVALEDGDVIFIPSTPSTVTVVGAVAQEGAFLFNRNKRLADYLRQAGGASRYGDIDRLYLVRADGTVRGSEKTSWFGTSVDQDLALAPGDTIVVPEGPERVTLTRTLKDWTQIFYQFGLGAAGIRILRGL